MQRLYLIFTLFIGMTSCQSESGNADKLVEYTDMGVQLASCQYAFDEGGLAPGNIPGQNLKTTYFGKVYDENLLLAVAHASGKETERFAGLIGVQYYRVDLSSPGGCDYTSSLKTAPYELDRDFRLSNRRLDGKILGVYYDREKSAYITKDSQIQPAILVKNDSDRYTMVHEYMHHLFAKEQPQGEITNSKNLSEQEKLYETANVLYEINKDSLSYHNLVVNYYNYIQSLIKYVSQYSLEEMAIESELSSLYEIGKLSYIHDLRRINGDRYILSSSEMIMNVIKSIKTDYELIRSYNINYKQAESSIVLNQIKSELDSIENQVYHLSRAAVIRLQKQNRGYVGVSSQQQIVNLMGETLGHDEFDCAHSHAEQNYLKNFIKKRKAQF